MLCMQNVINDVQRSSSRGAEEGDRAATPSVPAAADQGGHHRRRRHRRGRLHAGQARAARLRGRRHSIAEAFMGRAEPAPNFPVSGGSNSSCVEIQTHAPVSSLIFVQSLINTHVGLLFAAS